MVSHILNFGLRYNLFDLYMFQLALTFTTYVIHHRIDLYSSIDSITHLTFSQEFIHSCIFQLFLQFEIPKLPITIKKIQIIGCEKKNRTQTKIKNRHIITVEKDSQKGSFSAFSVILSSYVSLSASIIVSFVDSFHTECHGVILSRSI